MKKLIALLIALATIAIAREYTKTHRTDTTSEAGVTYMGFAASDHKKTSTNTVAGLEALPVWMIVRYTSTNTLHSNGSSLQYNATWTNRLSEVYK